MLFHEIYNNYYNAVAEILRRATEGTLTEAALYETVQRKAFSESVLTIPENLKNGSWPLLNGDFSTPLQHPPAMPLTLLQKRWLKSLLSDPRIRLFDPPATGLEEVEPLYPAETFVYFDRYTNGDPYEDPVYRRNFRTILQTLREGKGLRISFRDGKGGLHRWDRRPLNLEYSSKDDKFRLVLAGIPHPSTVNLGRIVDCCPLEEVPAGVAERDTRTLVLELLDERNALERVLLHFSHLEKETERLEANRYRLTLRYAREDETELLIRILSFGPMLKVLSPADFVKKIRDRIEKQMRIG